MNDFRKEMFSGNGMPGSTYAVAGTLALAVFILFASALRNDFVNWDDDLFVYANAHLRFLDWSFLLWSFMDAHTGTWIR
jgi:hypothetical protein